MASTDYQPISPVYLARAYDKDTQTKEDYDNGVSLNESCLNQNMNTLYQMTMELYEKYSDLSKSINK